MKTLFNENFNIIENSFSNRKKRTNNTNTQNKKFKKFVTQTTKTKFTKNEFIFDYKIMKIEFFNIFQNVKNLKKKFSKFTIFEKQFFAIYSSSFLRFTQTFSYT